MARAGGARRRAAEWVPAAVTLTAMIATPLAARGGAVRRLLSPVVVAGLAATTTAASTRRWGGPRAGAALAAVVTGTGLVEAVGSRRGVPFGRYAYTPRLWPQVGGVPAIVPLAWWAMAVPARETVVAALGPGSSRVQRVVGGAVALTAWDLFLDPQMVGEGFWTWARHGRYRGIPASNYAGWFATSLAVMAALDLLLPPTQPPPTASPGPTTSPWPAGTVSDSVAQDDRIRHGGRRGQPFERPGRARADEVLVGEYVGMAVMETLGFAAFFRDRVVAAVGGAAMLPPAVAAIGRLLRERRRA